MVERHLENSLTPLLTELVAPEAELVHQSMKGGTGHLDLPGGAGDVSPASDEGLDDQLALDALAGRAEIQISREDRGQLQVGRRDDRSGGHDDGALDTVFELAHVPGPMMHPKGRQRLRTEPANRFAGDLVAKTSEKRVGQDEDV